MYAFNTQEEIKAMSDVLNKHIKNAENENQLQIAHRNKLLFFVGINVGIRASDLRTLKFSFFLNDDGCFKEYYKFLPKKQKKYKKPIKIYFNTTVKKVITDYLELYPVENLDSYMFKSRKGDNAISVDSLYRIIKDTAKEAKIEKNIGSHSLRKTWGFWQWHNATDKSEKLDMLQECFKHSSSLTTLRYIGLMDEEKKSMYESIDLGLEYL